PTQREETPQKRLLIERRGLALPKYRRRHSTSLLLPASLPLSLSPIFTMFAGSHRSAAAASPGCTTAASTGRAAPGGWYEREGDGVDAVAGISQGEAFAEEDVAEVSAAG